MENVFVVERPEIVKYGDKEYIAVHLRQGDKQYMVHKTNFIPLSEAALANLSQTIDELCVEERAKFLEVLGGTLGREKADNNVVDKRESRGRKKASVEKAPEPAPEPDYEEPPVVGGCESRGDAGPANCPAVKVEPASGEPCLKKIVIGCDLAAVDFSVLKGIDNKDPNFIIVEVSAQGAPPKAPKRLNIAFAIDMQGSGLGEVRAALTAMVEELLEESRQPPTVVTETAPAEVRKEYVFEIPYGPRVKEFEKLVIKNKIAVTTQTNDQSTDLVIFRIAATPSAFLTLSEQYDELCRDEDAGEVVALPKKAAEETFVRGNPAMSAACFELIELQTGVKTAEALKNPPVLKAAAACTTEMIRRSMVFFRGGIVSREVVELFEREFASIKAKA